METVGIGMIGSGFMGLTYAQAITAHVAGAQLVALTGGRRAGELVGVYAPNYILSASPPSRMRRNMAFVTMLMAPAAPTGYLFGAISDHIRENKITAFGATDSTTFGFQASFAVCACLMTLGLVLTLFLLPARPKRDAND